MWFLLLLLCLSRLCIASSLGARSKIPSSHVLASCGTDVPVLPVSALSFLTDTSRGEINLPQTVKHINNHGCGNQLAGRMLDWDAPLYCNGPI